MVLVNVNTITVGPVTAAVMVGHEEFVKVNIHGKTVAAGQLVAPMLSVHPLTEFTQAGLITV